MAQASRMRRFGFLLVGGALFVLLAALPLRAAGANPDTQELFTQLEDLADVLGGLEGYDYLSEAVALTGIDITSDEALKLKTLLRDVVTQLKSDGDVIGSDLLTPEGRDALEAALEGADEGGALTVGAIAVTIGCTGDATTCAAPHAPVSVQPASGTAPLTGTDVSIPIRATLQKTVPLDLATNVVELGGGSLTADLALQTTLRVRFDPNEAAGAKVSLINPSTDRTTVALNATVTGSPEVTAALGFTDIGAELSDADVNLNLTATLSDPDVDGEITTSEWTHTALEDLVQLSRNGTAKGKLKLWAGILGTTKASPSFTHDFSDTGTPLSLANGFTFPSIDPPGLKDFLELTPEQVIGAFGQAATGLAGTQNVADVPLPFIKGALGDAYNVAKPLFDFVNQQAILCGLVPEDDAYTLPPTGVPPFRLEAGAKVYCQAYVTHGLEQTVSNVAWTPGTGVGTPTFVKVSDSSSGAADDTIGLQPDSVAVFTMDDAGMFDVTATYDVSYKLPDPENPLNLVTTNETGRTTERPARSAQQLLGKLASLAGFDGDAGNLSYDTTTKALTIRLRKTMGTDDFPEVKLGYDFGDQLEKASGVFGLQVKGPARAEVQVDDVELDVTLGALLIPDVDDVHEGQTCPDPVQEEAGACENTAIDRFFLQVDPAASEFEVGDATFAGTGPDLEGRLGFLGVEATGATVNVGKRAGHEDDPVLAVDVDPGDGLKVGTDTHLQNAIGLRRLLFDVSELVQTPAVNLAMSGSVGVHAMVGETRVPPSPVNPTITITWPDVTQGLPTVDTDDFGDLSAFDLSPNIFGKHTATASSDQTLTTAVTFSSAQQTELVGKRLENLTDGSYCEIASLAANTVTCKAEQITQEDGSGTTTVYLAGGDENDFDEHDEFKIHAGDPLELLWALLDNIDAVVGGIDAISDGAASGLMDTEIPVVAVAPRDLLAGLQELRKGTNAVRGAPGPSIVCGTAYAPSQADGDGEDPATWTGPDALQGDVSVVAGGGTVKCGVLHSKPITSVQWTATGSGVSVSDGATETATVGVNPSQFATLSFASNATLANDETDGYRVRAVIVDDDGEHAVDYPEVSTPATLQKLGPSLERALGLPSGTVQFSLGSVDGENALDVDLGFEVCSGGGLCTSGAHQQVPGVATPLSLDLGDAGQLVSVGASGNIDLNYMASIDLDMAQPLSVDDLSEPYVRPSTGITVKAKGSATDVDVRASLGPFGLVAGADAGGPGSATAKVGAQFAFAGTSSDPEPITEFFDNLTAELSAFGDNDCGTMAYTETSGDAPVDTTIGGGDAVACSLLSLGVQVGSSTEYVDDVGFAATLSGSSFTMTPYVNADFGDKIADAFTTLSWDLLFQALPGLLQRIEDGLRSSAGPEGQKIPLIGDALDAGADVAGVLRDDVLPLAEEARQAIDDEMEARRPPRSATPTVCKDSNGNAMDGYTAGDPCPPAEPGEGEDPPTCGVDGDGDPVACEFTGDEEGTDYSCEDGDGNTVPCEPQCPDGEDADGNCVVSVDVLGEIIEDFVWEYLGDGTGGADLIQESFGTDGDRDDVVAVIRCGSPAAACDDDDTLFDITDVRLTFNVGTGTTAALPFDLGLDGVPLRVAGGVEATASWNLLVDLGLSLEKGPYLVTDDAAMTNRPAEVEVGADVALIDDADQDADVCGSVIDDPTGGAIATAISTDVYEPSNRCLAGQLGFVGVNLRDNDKTDETTGVGLTTYLDIQRKTSMPGDLQILTLPDIVSGQLKPVLGLDVNAEVNVRFRTGIPSGQVAGFPSVVGTFKVEWNFAKATDGTGTGMARPTVDFGNLHIDASAFVDKYLKPTLTEVKHLTGPFKPVIDTLNAPLPVVSDLAGMVGQPPITLLGLMELVGDNNLTVIKSLAAFIAFANDSPIADGLIPLGSSGGGSFSMKSDLTATPQNPVDAAKAIAAGANKGTNLFSKPAVGGSSADLKSKAERTAVFTRDNLPGTFGVPGLTFPFMSDAGQVFGFIMGQDITLVRYDVGTLQATAGFSYNFGPFFIGPVPVTVGIGGSATLEGRFAIGYDTSGLRKVLSGGSGVHLFDGIFIDDLDAAGQDVPEIRLIGEVSARAGVTVFVATAGIEAGIRMTIDLNLDDRPEPDGKLRIEEIFNKMSNPICLFDVKGKLEAFLKAFLEIDYFIGSERWDWTIVEVTLLEFSGECAPPRPVLARVDSGKLVLHMGPDASRRNISTGVANEKFVVRPVGGSKYSVAAFGIYQVYDGVTSVFADGGSGQDTILLEPGSNENEAVGAVIPFGVPALIKGGTEGPNIIQTGAANDVVLASNSGDNVKAGAGNDIVVGGSGNDNVQGERGHDVIRGAGGGDTLAGGPGADYVDGGGDNDAVSGGPGAAPGEGEADARDVPDILVGGGGDDGLEGGWGNDALYGDGDLGAHGTGSGALVPIEPGLASIIGTANAGAEMVDKIPTLTAAGNVTTACADATAGGVDRLDGGQNDDALFGGGGGDTLVGAEGNDRICGNAGDDTVDGDDAGRETTGGSNADIRGGNDVLDGGDDQDTVLGRGGHDVAKGGDGHDVVRGGTGRDHVQGGEDNDDLFGGAGQDVIDGGNGINIAVGDDATINETSAPRSSRAETTANQDLRVAAVSNVSAGLTTDTTVWDCTYGTTAAGFSSLAVTSTSTNNGDCIKGGAGGDVVFGEGGRDYLEGNAGGDYLRGGTADDQLRGGADGDAMYGDSGADEMYGGSGPDTMRGGTEADYVEGNAGIDTIHGEAGADTILGGSDGTKGSGYSAEEKGSTDAGDVVYGHSGADVILGDNGNVTAGAVTLHDVGTQANEAAEAASGGDTIHGEGDADRIFGQGGIDTLHGGTEADRIEGNGAGDTIHGDEHADLLIGGTSAHATLKEATTGATTTYDKARDGGDTINGGGADDVIFGDNVSTEFDGQATFPASAGSATFGTDILNGDGGDDRLWGELGNDTLTGHEGHDYLLGDMGFIRPRNPVATWPGGAPNYEVVLWEPENGGKDDLFGKLGNDHLYGGWDVDRIEGGVGDDYAEGNGGGDELYGLAKSPDVAETAAEESSVGLAGDQDDLIGGSSTESESGTAEDGADTIKGNAGHDVLTGDNADVARIVDGGSWDDDLVMAGTRRRDVTLRDRDLTGTELEAVSGNDIMEGNDDIDRLYGGGGDDSMKGNDDPDYLEGNQGGDWVEGNDAEDDLIGGSSTLVGTQPDGRNDVGDPDGADFLFGGAAADVITGDNADVRRSSQDSPYYDTDAFSVGIGTRRWIVLHDLEAAMGGTFGNDAISAGAGVDIVLAQDGDDWVSGGSEDDYAEGNGGKDRILGDDLLSTLTGVPAAPTALSDLASGQPALDGIQAADGQDDLIGGSLLAGHRDDDDDIDGNGAADFVLGDNGTLLRTKLAGTYETFAQHYDPDMAYDTSFYRAAIRHDRALDATTTPTLADVSGHDVIHGNAGRDRLFGMAEDDTIYGNDDADYVEGNQGLDWIEGNDGEDDLIGGSSDYATGDVGDPDVSDFVYGGADADLILGDNGQITRFTMTAPYYDTDRFPLGFDEKRWVKRIDLEAETAGTFGPDRLSGGQGVDVAFGQDGGDFISGGSEGDYLEGNGGRDHIYGDRLEDGDRVRGQVDLPTSHGLRGTASTGDALQGEPGTDGQDDIIGGSNVAGQRDGLGTPIGRTASDPADLNQFGDYLYGDGNDDFVAGDNAQVTRYSDGTAYATYTTARNTDRAVRNVLRHDISGNDPGPAGTWGHDYVEGNDGDDAVWGQDGNDEIWGNDDDDDLHGELGDDLVYGSQGEDAMIGDRGSVTNTLIDPNDRGAKYDAFDIDSNGPPFLVYKAFVTHLLDRRVNLQTELPGSVGGPPADEVARALGTDDRTGGGNDVLRGGQDHDVMHGGAADDILNGDSGGDYLFGGEGSDVMWGGRGNPDPHGDPDARSTGDAGTDPTIETFDDGWVDYLFGGRGGPKTTENGIVTGGADVMDYNPRPAGTVTDKKGNVTVTGDPQVWHDNVAGYTNRYGDVEEAATYDLNGTAFRQLQHHHGIDWIYGGWDRDVMQANNAGQGPNVGDRLLDWAGAFNLYTHCEPDYGGYNDLRAISPQMLTIMQQLAYASGVGGTLDEVGQPNSSAFNELALVYNSDVKNNTGKAYPTTPGHFQNIACTADPVVTP